MARPQPARDPGFGQRLVEAMHEARRRPGELARTLEVHPTTMSRWRRGELPDPRALTTLAQTLGVRVEWLKTGEAPRTGQVREPTASYPVSRAEMAFLEGMRRIADYRDRGELVPPPVAERLLSDLWNAGRVTSPAAGAADAGDRAAVEGMLTEVEAARRQPDPKQPGKRGA